MITTGMRRAALKIVREPLLHFIVLGALLFWWSGAERAERDIVIEPARLENLQQNFVRTWGREPSALEHTELIEEYVREEVLNREAVRLGLDQEDAVIRRRLRQKMEAIADETVPPPPNAAALQALYAQHRQDYARPARVAFHHLVLDPADKKSAETWLAELNALPSQQAAAQAQALNHRRLLPSAWAASDLNVIREQFGADFAEQMLRAPNVPIGVWQGPWRSAFGQHLVRIDQVELAKPLSLPEVTPLLLEQSHNAARIKAQNALYQRLRAQYRIVLPTPPNH